LDSHTIRNQVLKRLRDLSADKSSRALQESELEQKVRHWLDPYLTTGRKIAAYRALDLEVPIEKFLPAEREIAFPSITDPKEGLMQFRLARLDRADDWQRGAYGIFEPRSHCPILDPLDVDVIFVPGVAFTRNKDRLGRGRGFYDRILALMPSAIKVSVVFREQLVERIPTKDWDQKVDLLISPSQR
jgi:5-formyltetrahydrofolate cyclo-ligase